MFNLGFALAQSKDQENAIDAIRMQSPSYLEIWLAKNGGKIPASFSKLEALVMQNLSELDGSSENREIVGVSIPQGRSPESPEWTNLFPRKLRAYFEKFQPFNGQPAKRRVLRSPPALFLGYAPLSRKCS